MPGPSRLDDPYFYDGTTIMRKYGIVTEVLNVDVPRYKRLGYKEVGPGQSSMQTSYTDKAKVRAFNSTKRFFVTDPGEREDPYDDLY